MAKEQTGSETTLAALKAEIDMNRLPRHIAIIMDGNGRWAQQRNMPRSYGHRAGATALRRVAEICREIGIEVLTVYAFSTENWQRPKLEIDFLMNLFVDYLRNEVRTMNEQDIRLGFLGEWERLPQRVQEELHRALAATAANHSMLLNLAVNYGARRELVLATKKIAQAVLAGQMNLEDIDEPQLSQALFTAGLPDPDLLIRPSGEQRLSNFLLWQCAYTEFYYEEILWPDYDKADLLRALIAYQGRERRFGRVDKVGKI